MVANPLHAPAGDRIQRRRAQCLSGTQAETRVVPRAPHCLVDDQALGQRPVVMRALRAYGEKSVAAAHEDRIFRIDASLHHPAIRHIVKRDPASQIQLRSVFHGGVTWQAVIVRHVLHSRNVAEALRDPANLWRGRATEVRSIPTQEPAISRWRRQCRAARVTRIAHNSLIATLENTVIHRGLVCLFSLCLPFPAAGEGLYKCETPSGITYQGFPCDGRQAVQSVVENATDSSSVRMTPDCESRSRPTLKQVWRRTALCIGMTDDEVLNLPGWGRPAKIIGTRGHRVWREQWVYDERVDFSRRLHFVNGKLSLVEMGRIETSSGPIVSLSPQ